MELIIGGACQGQLAYAKERYPDISWTDGGDASLEEICRAQAVFDLHLFIRSQVKEKKDTANLAGTIIEKNPGLLIVSNEVGYGVVPMDAFEREWREAVGRVCTELAAASSRVTRVICGIGTIIKDMK